MANRGKPYLHAVCIGCELTERTNKKQRNRPREKARKALSRHATKYIKEGLVSSAQEFTSLFGYSVDQMAHDIEHAFQNGCPYCGRSFASMAHGLNDVTLDIIDPKRPPNYRTNTRWVCNTCNSEKQKTDADLWDMKCQCWAEYERRQVARADDPWYGTLFAGQQKAGQSSMF